MTNTLPLSTAKARFSEVVRGVRRSGVPVVVTVDGEPAVAITPLAPVPRSLTVHEQTTDRALFDALLRATRPTEAFHAVALVGEGRR